MKQPKRYLEKVTGAWKSFQRIAFEQAGLEAVFQHVRNLVICTLIIAAGVHGHSISPLTALGLEAIGYGVALTGLILAILNLLDGFHKLAKTNKPILLRVVVIMLYLFFSVRITQLVLLFRIS